MAAVTRDRAVRTDEAAARQAAAVLELQDFFEGCSILGVAKVPEQDWVRLTQSQFAPVEITPEFWIVPTWHEPPAQARQVIRLDPGLAFGTGTHPTTRMCLRWIADRAMASDQRVLDYGCGSGILAIGGGEIRRGATSMRWTSIRPRSNRRELNAEANAVQLNTGLPDAR